jgi:RNA polymerase sigma-70 factor, ECF subfamily
MTQHTFRLPPLELSLEVRRQALAGLVAGRDPPSQKSVHDPFDARTLHLDASYVASYDAPMPPPDDAALVTRAQSGDLEAFAELIRRHEHRIRVVLFRLLEDERDVEEATQDAFVQAWRSLASFRGEAAVFTWLYRIAVNEALMRLRRKRVPLAPLDEAAERRFTAPAANEPEPAAEASELASFLSARLRSLPLETRAPLVLRDVVGLSNQDVADILGLSVAATKSRIHRARMQIREDIEKWERSS